MNNSINPSGLSYYLPEVDKVHTVLHIPGSHTLYIGPSACTRRHAIHAHEFGDRNDVSFLFITESDIISGDYELIVGDAIEDLIAVLSPQPHIFILAVFCIDDFLGTDDKVLVSQLSERFPDRFFTVDHIDPVVLGENPQNSMKRRHFDMYSFLRPEKTHDRGVNFMGNFVSHEPECEIYSLLRSWNAGPVRELFNCKEYSEYQDMATSSIAIGMRHVSKKSVKYMEETLGIPYYYFPTSYDTDFISNGYAEIARMLGCPSPDLHVMAEDAANDARRTAEALKGIALAIDSSAFMMTFSTALALIGYGFDIKYIFRGGHLFDGEAEAYEKVKALGVSQVLWSDEYGNRRVEADCDNIIAVGADAQRILNAKMFADIWHDEGYYGFHGIHRLMELLRKTAGVM
ncbi:MAG: hypothetical protein HUJ65_02650 [Oscillospiraceae bacterium]|nr:hypothetical protein [Oscillospiraceae bacterium]